MTASSTGIKITQPPLNVSSVKTVSVTGLTPTSLTVKPTPSTVKTVTTVQGTTANKAVVSIKHVVTQPSHQTIVPAVAQVTKANKNVSV